MKILELRDRLRDHPHRLVLAESCTAGLVAAELGQVPGISEFFCGSLVVYRNDSKAQWLGIARHLLDDPAIGPVSAEVTRALAQAALGRTPEATVAAAVTGHLGPSAPEGFDGVVHCAAVFSSEPSAVRVAKFHLDAPAPLDGDDLQRRYARQVEATRRTIDFLIEALTR